MARAQPGGCQNVLIMMLSVAAISWILVCSAATQTLPVVEPRPLAQLIRQHDLQLQTVSEQAPAMPPQVSFKEGLLTIIADNCTLGDILRSVRQETGASVDLPQDATERVVGRFGPGPARDVLALLLNGTQFNYVLLGSASDGNGLVRVVLMSKRMEVEQPIEQPSTVPSPIVTPPASGNGFITFDDGQVGMIESPNPETKSGSRRPDGLAEKSSGQPR